MEVCRTFTDKEVIAANFGLSALPKILAGRTCDEHKKVLAERRKKINEEIKEIPARIDEQSRAMPELKSTNAPVIIATLTKLREQLGAKQAEIARIDAGGGAAELAERLSLNDTALQSIRNSQSQRCHQQKVEGSRRQPAGRNRMASGPGMGFIRGILWEVPF